MYGGSCGSCWVARSGEGIYWATQNCRNFESKFWLGLHHQLLNGKLQTQQSSMAANDEATTAVLPLYKGSCHCGFINYTARLDLDNLSPETGAVVTKCSCSICHNSGTLLATPAPASLKILSPPEGRAALQDYTFGGGKVHHWMCP
jgi:hypothetical protein